MEPVNYLPSTSVTKLISILSEFIENNVLGQLRPGKFTLLADESTDASNRASTGNCATRHDVIAMILVLTNVLNPVNYLSLYLQQDCETFTELPAGVKNCTD